MWSTYEHQNPAHQGPGIAATTMRLIERARLCLLPSSPLKLIMPSRAVARHTSEPAESLSQAITWAADEHVICALAAGWWLFCRFQPPPQQRVSNHLLLTAVTTAIIPHILKKAFNQRRPDRVMIKAHLHGLPFSGKARDAFPSGPAIHMGALA
jgi:undecaprenyl-diphosphatase